MAGSGHIPEATVARLPLYLRALAIQERTLAPDSNELRDTLSDYDELLRATGRETEG